MKARDLKPGLWFRKVKMSKLAPYYTSEYGGFWNQELIVEGYDYFIQRTEPDFVHTIFSARSASDSDGKPRNFGDIYLYLRGYNNINNSSSRVNIHCWSELDLTISLSSSAKKKLRCTS